VIPVLVITQYSLWAHKFSYSDVNFYVGLVVKTDPPLPFGRICFVVLVMRKGGESS